MTLPGVYKRHSRGVHGDSRRAGTLSVKLGKASSRGLSISPWVELRSMALSASHEEGVPVPPESRLASR